MAKVSWNASDTDINISRHGCLMQAESRGIDITDPNIASFIDNEIMVIATASAEIRWLRGIIDEMTTKIQKLEQKS